MTLGFQAPRLPWGYPASAAKFFPSSADLPLPLHTEAPQEWASLEWYRPSEIDTYSDISNTHDTPIPLEKQQELRRAYYSAVTHVDDLFADILVALDSLELTQSTTVALVADHGQNLGEHNMWSMMNLLETALQVPLIIKPLFSSVPVFPHPVELVDLYPTLTALAGLPLPQDLPGKDLTAPMQSGRAENFVALGQVTRCRNCTLAYLKKDPTNPNLLPGCANDSVDDMYTVPCFSTPPDQYDYMGMSVRTDQWRYSLFCDWDGSSLAPDFYACSQAELHDLRNNTNVLFDEDSEEHTNVADVPEFASVVKRLDALLRASFYQ